MSLAKFQRSFTLEFDQLRVIAKSPSSYSPLKRSPGYRVRRQKRVFPASYIRFDPGQSS